MYDKVRVEKFFCVLYCNTAKSIRSTVIASCSRKFITNDVSNDRYPHDEHQPSHNANGNHRSRQHNQYNRQHEKSVLSISIWNMSMSITSWSKYYKPLNLSLQPSYNNNNNNNNYNASMQDESARACILQCFFEEFKMVSERERDWNNIEYNVNCEWKKERQKTKERELTTRRLQESVSFLLISFLKNIYLEKHGIILISLSFSHSNPIRFHFVIFKFDLLLLLTCSGESRRLPGQKKDGSGLDARCRLGAEKLLSWRDRSMLSHHGISSDDVRWQMFLCQATYRLSCWNCESQLLGLGWRTCDGLSSNTNSLLPNSSARLTFVEIPPQLSSSSSSFALLDHNKHFPALFACETSWFYSRSCLARMSAGFSISQLRSSDAESSNVHWKCLQGRRCRRELWEIS